MSGAPIEVHAYPGTLSGLTCEAPGCVASATWQVCTFLPLDEDGDDRDASDWTCERHLPAAVARAARLLGDVL